MKSSMDFNTLNTVLNRDKIAIVCVGYNRLPGLKRLLESVETANYGTCDIPLVISIDCSNDQAVYDFANSFNWSHGTKYVNIQQERLGLKNHIFQCGGLTKYFAGVIILEDDIFVAPDFYKYTIISVKAYDNNPKVAGIALYRNDVNGYVGLPFYPYNDGSDVFLFQDVCTWGQCFTTYMWERFLEFMKRDDVDYIIQNTSMPLSIKRWTKAWSKYFYAFMSTTDSYFVTPYNSFTTNFSDAGVHGRATNFVQVSMQWNIKREFLFLPVDKCVRYDFWANNECLYETLGYKQEDLCLDLYGDNDNIHNKRYILTPNKLQYQVLVSYGLRFRPHELNVIYKIEGNDLFLYDTKTIGSKPKSDSFTRIDYYLNGFNVRLLFSYVVKCYFDAFLRCLRRLFR